MNVTADALNAALVHSLWQDAIVGLLLWTRSRRAAPSRANARYLACCAALALMAALPIVTTIVLSERGFRGPFADAADCCRRATDQRRNRYRRIRTAVVRGSDAWTGWRRSTPWMLPVWLVGVGVCSLRLVLASIAHRRADATQRSGGRADHVNRRHACGPDRCRSIGRGADLDDDGQPGHAWLSASCDSASTRGRARRHAAAARGAARARARAHTPARLSGERAADAGGNAVLLSPRCLVGIERMRIERELCCDDIAVDACGDAVGYAQALTKVARLMVGRPGMALGADGGPLLLRIQRLLGVDAAGSPVSPLWVTVASLVMIVAVMFTGPYAQSPSPGTLAPADTGSDAALRGRVVDARTGDPIAGASVRAQYITGVENPPKCPIGDCEDVGDRVAGRISDLSRTTAGPMATSTYRSETGRLSRGRRGAGLRSALLRPDVG